MIKILIAPDKFKGSLTAEQVCSAIEDGLNQKNTTLKITSVPLADGGEGTCELLTRYTKGHKIEMWVNDPLLNPTKAGYGISNDGTTAFIEMAAASGLQLLKQADRNPLYTTTYGTGELIKDALDRGVEKIILGIGGSATTDAGIGMAAALGYEFYDAAGNSLTPIGINLNHLRSIKAARVHPRLREVNFVTLCDVNNPLFGPEGAAFVYGPQKGADQKTVHLLDDGLRNFARVVETSFKTSVNFPGAGAAGGLGAGSKIFLNASIRKGIDYIIEATLLKEKIKDADIIITGEGKIDAQSLSGKVVMEVSHLASQFDRPVYVICGVCELNPEDLLKAGIDHLLSLVDHETTAVEAMTHAAELIKRKIANYPLL